MKFLLCFLALIAFSAAFAPQSSANVLSTLRMLAVGEVAPDFELTNLEGKKFKLSTLKGKSPAVVFFYPADNSPGCTKEVCAFEKRY